MASWPNMLLAMTLVTKINPISTHPKFKSYRLQTSGEAKRQPKSAGNRKQLKSTKNRRQPKTTAKPKRMKVKKFLLEIQESMNC